MNRYFNVISCFAVFIMVFMLQTTALANSLKIVSEEKSGIVIEYKIPSYSVAKELSDDGTECSRIVIPDTVDIYEPGTPLLPKKSFLIAIPDNVIPQIKILSKEFEELRDIKITLQKKANSVFEENGIKTEGISVSDAFFPNALLYPSKLIEVEDAAFIRNQKVARISIYPASYSAQNSIIKLLKRIKFKVNFIKEGRSSRRIHDKTAGVPRGRNPVFDSLINNSVVNRYKPQEKSDKRSSNPSFKKIKPSEFTLKIKTKKEGIYMIAYQDFNKMNYSPESINPLNLRLFHKGVEVPVYIEGEDDGEFNKNDYLIFYAKEVESDYTSYNQYFLKYGSTARLRMKKTEGAPADIANAVGELKNKTHFEESNQYKKYSSDENADHWYWAQVNSGEKKNIFFTISNLIQKGDNASIKINLRGLTYSISDYETAYHHAKISINGNTFLGDAYFKGQEEFVGEYVISDTNLYDGDNYITLENPGVITTYDKVDIFLLDYFEIDYNRKLSAIKDELLFPSEGTGEETFGISGFSNKNIWIFNVTDNSLPEIISDTVITSFVASDLDHYSQYKIFFSDLSQGQKSFYVLSSDKFKRPLSIKSIGKTKLKSGAKGADYLIITHDNFFDAVKPLIKFRRKMGLKAKAVRVSDIYDEFGYGIHDVQAIKDFLKYTYENWDPVPSFVLLVGDTIVDYKNYLNYGRKSYIPTKIIYSSRFNAEYPSDNWFVEVNGDDALPDMFIGRIPANSADEVVNAVKKIKFYEKRKYGKDWQKRILLVADNNEADYETSLDYLSENIITSGFDIKKIYISNYENCNNSDCSVVTDEIFAEMKKGNLVTVYSGHGNVNNWAGELVLQSSDVDSFRGRKNPFIMALNCNNGYFYRLGEYHSLGEKLVIVPKSGAIASFVNSGNGYSGEQNILLDNLFEYMLTGNENQVGYITTQAKIASFSQGLSDEIMRFFILFGDPAVRLKINSGRIIPVHPLNSDEVSKLNKDTFVFSWQAPSGFKFRIQFSKDEFFTEKYDFGLPVKGWIKSNRKKISTKNFGIIKKMIEDNSGSLFWRIKGKSGSGADKKIIFSKSRKLR